MARYFFRSHSFIIGLIVFIFFVLFCFIGPTIVSTDPVEMDYSVILRGPNFVHPLGTDDLGRDVLSRVIHGGQISLVVGAFTMLATGVLGGIVGLLAGYIRRLDTPLMRVMDALMAFPSLLLALTVMAALGSSIRNVIIALTLAYTPRTARLVRSTVLNIQNLTYVEAARAVAVPTWRILSHHILPSSLPTLVVQETFIFAYAILGEAGLSFVGVGIQPPQPSLGNILGDARALIQFAPWLIFFPGLAIVLSVLSLNLMGDGLQEIIDPKRRKTKGEF